MSLEVEAFVALASHQLATQVKFYQTFLQIEPNPHSDKYAEFRLSGLRLAIFTPSAEHASVFTAQTSGTQTSGTQTSGAMSLCIEVNDLAQAIAQLTEMGHSPTGDIISASHGQEIYVYDPDGNRLILHQAN